MAKKVGEELLKEAGKKEASQIFSRLNSGKTALTARLTRLVPTRFLWVLPWLKENADLKETLEEIKGKGEETGEEAIAEEATPVASTSVRQGAKLLYPKYRCAVGNPLACEFPARSLQENPTAKSCINCGFPGLLPPETKIRGSRGSYQVQGHLHNRGMGRLYKGMQLSDRSPVVIKEYLLPERYFNPQETRERKELFARLAGIKLADGRVQDFRLIAPIEAIADPLEPRCYLVTPGDRGAAPSLANYMEEKGAPTTGDLWEILDRLLQSLESLHGQKYRQPSGLIQSGLAHGNLSLDTLLVVTHAEGLFAYLSDLLLWERIFDLPVSERRIASPEKDLKDLGQIAFYLLAGDRTLDPSLEENWPDDASAILKNFILDLIGLGTVRYDNAAVAREALFKLIPEKSKKKESLLPDEPETEEKKRKRRPLMFWLLGGIGVALLAMLIWLATRAIMPRTRQTADREPLPCCIKQVAGIPVGNFIYTGSQGGIWSYALQQENQIAKGKNLAGELYSRKPKFNLRYEPEPTEIEAIARVRSGEADFAIASLATLEESYPSSLYTELGYEEFAYDGLAVFVAFNYAKRTNSLTQGLNGQISLEQVRDLYLGKITNWQEIGGPNLPVKLFVPAENEALQIFEERVLKDVGAIAAFRKRLESSVEKIGAEESSFIELTPEITILPTFKTLSQVLRDFEENNIGAIGFGTLSKVFGQCSVYPLALAEGNKPAIAPLIQANNEPATPFIDLCNAKGSYAPNQEAFIKQRYPLAYSLGVAYLRDNRRPPAGKRFAAMLRTVEGQELLQKTGLIPIEPLK